MSFLDLYPGDQSEAMKMRPNEATRLPSTFTDTFSAAWNEGRMFSQSVAGENARSAALQDYLDDVQSKTGENVGTQIDWQDSAVGVGPIGGITASQAMPQVKAAVDRINAKRTTPIDDLTDEQLDQRAIEKSRAARQTYAETALRERTLGGTLGMLAGGVSAAATDPINLLALPIAPEAEVGVIANALRWGLIGGGAQVAIEGAGAPYREQVQPGYLASGEPLGNVAESVLGGAAFGFGTKALGNVWTRLKTGVWPTSVKDAGNVLESEAHVADSNVLPGAAGEAAHRDALSGAIDDVLNGRPVDVSHIITPEIEAQTRGILDRLEGEQGMALPVINPRAIQLASEAARLRAEDAELASHIEQLPQGDPVAADRLNRLRTVDQQIAEATDPASKRSLAERRDQILVDTTPEQLSADAAPIEAARVANAQRRSISARLDEIAAERARMQADNLSTQAMLGQRSPVRPVEPTLEAPIASPEQLKATLQSPEHGQAVRADIDRELVSGDRQIPVGVDNEGNPITRSLDEMTSELDAYKTAAEHIQACATATPTPAEAANG